MSPPCTGAWIETLQSETRDDADRDLVERCRTGDRRAFRLLVERYERMVFHTVVTMIGDPVEADDVAQEVFIKVYRSIRQFEGQSKFSVWLYRVAVNQCLDYLKYRNRRPQAVSIDGIMRENDGTLEFLFMDPAPAADEAYEDRQLQAAIRRILDSLTPEQRLIIRLKDIEGRSQEEIAGILGCPVGTVKSRLNRAREVLKDRLRPFYELWRSGERP